MNDLWLGIRLGLILGWCSGHEAGYREGCRDAWQSSLTRYREQFGPPPSPTRGLIVIGTLAALAGMATVAAWLRL